MADISQTALSDEFCLMKMFEFWLMFEAWGNCTYSINKYGII